MPTTYCDCPIYRRQDWPTVCEFLGAMPSGLIALPPYSPELNPVERLWLYLRERFLSLRVFDDHDAIIDACCQAWNAAADDAERIKSLCLQTWIRKVIST